MAPHFSSLFQDYLTRHEFQGAPQELYDPVNYILRSGGKRLRPLLTLQGAALFDDRLERALPVAMAVEIFHNFTLIHDDVMDAAPLRRSLPTVHAKYGLNAGVLSGDVMLIYAYHFLMQTDDPALQGSLLTTFNKMAIEVCEGQQYDMNFETRTDVSISDYLRMIELKTASLIAAAFKMGALVGGASIAEANRLSEFGRNTGIAFQLQDDVLDAFGDPEKFGKKIGGDIVQNKKTYLALKAFELANAEQKEELRELLSATPVDENAKIERVRDLFLDLDVRNHAEGLMNEYARAAFKSLDKMDIAAKQKNDLKKWANKLLARET